MLYSLIQTLVCVLLINGGLHALHLKGNGDTAGRSSISASKSINEPVVLLSGNQFHGLNPNHEHIQHAATPLKQYETAGRLSDALADLAQLDREHLMSSIDKQTEAAAAGRQHGRPIIAGRIHMSPKNDLVNEGDYTGLLMPSLSRGFMFGHVVKQPPAENKDEILGLGSEFSGGGTNKNSANLRPMKYEYGRVVQPDVVDTDYDAQHIPLDLDSFMELEQEPDAEDDFDLDSYQYLDELLAEDQQREWQELSANHRPNNPYQTLEEVQADTPQALLELFHKDQGSTQGHQQTQHQRQFQTRSGFIPSNIRLQQKWHSKRAHQLPLKRNIFGQNKQQQSQLQKTYDDPPQPHYFNQRHNSMFSSFGSEATAYSKNNDNNNNNNNNNENENENTKSAKELNENLKSAVKTMRNLNNQDASLQRQQSSSQKLIGHSTTANKILEQQQQQQTQDAEHRVKEEVLAHPNQKRSGGGLIPPGMSTAGSHSIASQLMLRTARGQRQYDVPQIGKSSIFFTFDRHVNQSVVLQVFS